MVSLIFGLLALACNILSLIPIQVIPEIGSGMLAFIGFALAIVAVATGSSILKSDKSDKNARAGKAIGTVCIVLAVLAIVIFFVFTLGTVACATAAISCAS